MSMLTPSPCIGICRIDESSGLCVGCARTSEEVATWRGASTTVLERIWAELPGHFSPHSFRVTTVTDLLEQNVPLDVGRPYCLLEQDYPGLTTNRCGDDLSTHGTFFGKRNDRQRVSRHGASIPARGQDRWVSPLE